jgi:hypothetical protein
MQINGTLRNARRLGAGEHHRAPCLSGEIYGDTKGRFTDGEAVVTSTITEELPDDVFKTTFSAYRVESWAAADPALEALEAVLKPLGMQLRHYEPRHRDAAIEAMRGVLSAAKAA